MEKRTAEKTAVLVTCTAIMILSVFPPQEWNTIAISAACSWKGRVLYHFFHANIIHAALNAWCILSLVFLYNISLWRIILAYITATTIPVDTMATCIPSMHLPTVGLSAIVFFLFGSISFMVQRKRYYQAWMLCYIVIGFLTPNTNAFIHLYTYTAGLIYAILNKPIIVNR